MFDGENISFDASLVIYININNILPIMIINRIYENQNLLSLSLVSFLVGLRTYQHPLYIKFIMHESEKGCGVLMEIYRERQTEVLRVKSISVPFCTP